MYRNRLISKSNKNSSVIYLSAECSSAIRTGQTGRIITVIVRRRAQSAECQSANRTGQIGRIITVFVLRTAQSSTFQLNLRQL